MQRMVQQAEERYKPYSEVDMILASKNLDDADFAQLRKEAQAAHDDLKFIKEEADNFYTGLQQQQQQQLQEAAKEAVRVLEQDIPEWSNQLYDDIRSYAIGQGLPEAEVNSYVNPSVIKVLNKARLYDQAKESHHYEKETGREESAEVKESTSQQHAAEGKTHQRCTSQAVAVSWQ